MLASILITHSKARPSPIASVNPDRLIKIDWESPRRHGEDRRKEADRQRVEGETSKGAKRDGVKTAEVPSGFVSQPVTYQRPDHGRYNG